MFIARWWKRRQERKRKEREQRGYDYAMDALKSSRLTTDELEFFAINPWDYPNEFDTGILNAIEVWKMNATKEYCDASQSTTKTA